MPTSRRASAQAATADSTAPAVRTLKKYPNRRLYDTRTSSYITLADVKAMVLACEDFVVLDAKSGEDLTRSILLQIILEEESGGVPMFSAATLAQIIRFYGHAMQGVMGAMMERNLHAFTELQAQFMNQGKSLGRVDPKLFTPEAWAQFLGAQPAALQGLMGGYVEQGRSMVDAMQKAGAAAGALFPGMPGFAPGKKQG